MGWRYIAQRVTDQGFGEFLDWDLSIRDPQLTDVLSGPKQLTGAVSLRDDEITANDGRPLLEEWGTYIHAEADGELRGGGFVVNSSLNDDDEYEIECVGFGHYPNDQPFIDSWYGVQVDPLDVFRRIWDHLQGQPGGNLGVTIDPLTSPVRIGTELEQVQFEAETSPGVRETVSFEAGPVKLSWYVTHDLGAKIDELAKECPFDWHETSRWIGPRQIEHHIELGYPRIGERRHDLRFVLGENIHRQPTVSRDGDRYATGFMALGAGEGSEMVRSPIISRNDPGHLRRIATLSDKKLKSVKAATERANEELARRLVLDDITSLVITDHPHARITKLHVGDEIPVRIISRSLDTTIWVRIVAISYSPDDDSVANVTVIRTEKLTT